VLGLVFSRRAPGPEAMVRWERAFVGSLAAVTLAWGLGGWLVMPADSPVHQAIVYFFLMGVAGGAVATYSAHAVAAGLAICALMLPATIGFALQEALELRLMAAGGALYIVAALRSMRGFGFFLRRTLQLSYELQQAYARVREQAHTDELTGLANRRAFVEIGTAATDQARRYHRPLALLMMDIDHFKRINDTFGHALGDAALRAAAGTLRQAARRADTAGRLGGEEFALLMPETTLDQAEGRRRADPPGRRGRHRPAREHPHPVHLQHRGRPADPDRQRPRWPAPRRGRGPVPGQGGGAEPGGR
jgi:diguanylate cyclase